MSFPMAYPMPKHDIPKLRMAIAAMMKFTPSISNPPFYERAKPPTVMVAPRIL